MLSELALRFVLGGAIVSAFAIGGETFKPKTFAGMFGAAPSVALVSLALAYAKHGATYVSSEALPMLFGGVAFFVYATSCILALRVRRLPVWLGATTSWAAWFAVALSLGVLGIRAESLR